MAENAPESPDPMPAAPPAHACAAVRDWPGYFRAVSGRPPRETLLAALDAFDREALPDARRAAIDLGCGEGRDSAELLRRGWRVLAIDGHPEAMVLTPARVRAELPALARADGTIAGLEVRSAEFEGLTLPVATLVNASFSLPFCRPGAFADLWNVIRGALAPGGRFAGQFFGDRDDWARLPDRSHHTRAEVLALLHGLDLERFDEEDRPGTDATGASKHWHVFHVVARNPAKAEGKKQS